MITFVLSEDHQYTIRDVLETRDHGLHGKVVILSHAEFQTLPRLPKSVYAFLDIERLDDINLAQTTARLTKLREMVPDLIVLNPPEQVQGRLAVMSRLFEAGINDFRVLPITAPPEDLRYPVFLRYLDNHKGPVSALLDNATALEIALDALPYEDRAAGRVVITEYIDARNQAGLHEKRSYARVGDVLFPAALDNSHHWVCKGEQTDPHNVLVAEAELAFMDDKSDEAALRHVFETAGIEYGRADYAIVKGRPQIFEINTNPWIAPPERLAGSAYEGGARVVQHWLDALAQLSVASGVQKSDWVKVPELSVARPARKLNRKAAIGSVLTFLGQEHNETRFMQKLRRFKII